MKQRLPRGAFRATRTITAIATAATVLCSTSACIISPNVIQASEESSAAVSGQAEPSQSWTLSDPTIVYTAGDTVVVGDDNHQTVWSIEIEQILPDARAIVGSDPPSGQRFAAVEASFTMLSGPANADANYSIEFAAIGDAQQAYDSTTAVEYVAADDYYLLDPFQQGVTQSGQALILVPAAVDAKRWEIRVSGTDDAWQLQAE